MPLSRKRALARNDTHGLCTRRPRKRLGRIAWGIRANLWDKQFVVGDKGRQRSTARRRHSSRSHTIGGVERWVVRQRIDVGKAVPVSIKIRAKAHAARCAAVRKLRTCASFHLGTTLMAIPHEMRDARNAPCHLPELSRGGTAQNAVACHSARGHHAQQSLVRTADNRRIVDAMHAPRSHLIE